MYLNQKRLSLGWLTVATQKPVTQQPAVRQCQYGHLHSVEATYVTGLLHESEQVIAELALCCQHISEYLAGHLPNHETRDFRVTKLRRK